MLDLENNENELTILFEKAKTFRTMIEKIVADQNAFEKDLEEAQTMFAIAESNEKEIRKIINKLECILASEQINEEYHADVRKEAETLISEAKAYEDDQSPAGYRAYTQQILDDARKVYIDPVDPDELLEKLRTTEFIKSN